VSPVRYELGFYIPEDGTVHSHRRDNLKFFCTQFFFKKNASYTFEPQQLMILTIGCYEEHRLQGQNAVPSVRVHRRR
jgi:hypothetical protein